MKLTPYRHWDDIHRGLQFLAVALCPAMENHPEIVEYCLQPLASERLSDALQQKLAVLIGNSAVPCPASRPSVNRPKFALVPLRAAGNLLLVDADPVELVRSGYNAISRAYRGDDDPAHKYDPWLADLLERIPGRGQVLDVGCGCGVPVARQLAAAGHQVTGVDISDVQIKRARRLVPGAVFLRADATETDFPPGSFDAVVCLYALIHMPLDRQPRLLGDIARWLRPGGWLLAVTGQDAWTGTEDNWLGGPATMWWSQADAVTYRAWLGQAGLEVTGQQFVPERDGGHALFWARLKAS